MNPPQEKIPVAILGATGAVGQRFLERLAHHPVFEPTVLAASDRSAGKTYAEATTWVLDSPLPAAAAKRTVVGLGGVAASEARVCFSALPSDQAREWERPLAAAGKAVFTNASPYRMAPDVPLLIPEVNPDHLALVERQDTPDGGFLVANGNCSGIILTLALAPLHRAFGISDVHVTTLQGLSGAGYPGVSAMDVVDNVVPYIGGEEDKLETEPQRTLGGLDEAAEFTVHPTCTRVPVREGHLESVHLTLGRAASLDEVRAALADFRGPPEVAGLPSAPEQPIQVLDADDRPQPRRDRDLAGGMAVSIGRLRLTGDGRSLRMVILGHNTVRGAAGQSVLNAEYAHAMGHMA
ncbi:MAG: aspartate-semialdehyde dehydrogenase [Thermoplasmatota archaeon]